MARQFNVAEDVAYTCETAAHFWLMHVLSRCVAAASFAYTCCWCRLHRHLASLCTLQLLTQLNGVLGFKKTGFRVKKKGKGLWVLRNWV